MKKNIFAVCDLEVEYAFNFMDYLNQKRNLPFEIQVFTTAESLVAYGKENHIELLLISDKAMQREVRELGIGKIIILSEGVIPVLIRCNTRSNGLLWRGKVIKPCGFSGNEKEYGHYRCFFTTWQMPENILCACVGADSGKRTGGSLSES